MSSADYERLLAELADELTTHGSPQTRRTEFDQELDELDDRLLNQQADLLHACPKLRFSPPRLTGTPPAVPPEDSRKAIDRAHRHIDTSGTALTQAMRWATMPQFLPKARPRTRHLAVYALCAVAAVAIHAVVILRYGVTAAALGFAIAPLSAFTVGYLLIGGLGRPRLRPRKPPPLNRYPKVGLILCVGVDLLAAVAWLTA